MIQKKIKLILLSSLAILVSISLSFAQTNVFNASKKINEEIKRIQKENKEFKWRKHEGTPLPEFEKLTFNVMWQFISVGEATLELKGFNEIERRKAHHIYSHAKTKPFFDEVFPVRDVNQAWLDYESMSALRFISDISEGDWKKNEEIYYNQISKTFLLNDNGKMQKGTIPEYVQDVLTALYYVRTINLEIGKEYTLEAHTGDLSWPLKVKVLKTEKKKTKTGTFDCIVVEPLVRDDAGIFKAQGTILVWLTNDERKMPVYLKAKIPVGSINAVLEQIDMNPPVDLTEAK